MSCPQGLSYPHSESMFKTAGVEELKAPDGIHQTMSEIQSKTAFLPDYGFKAPENESAASTGEGEGEASWPAVSGGTSVAGLVGAGLTLAFAALIGFAVSLFKKKKHNLTA